MKKNLLFAISVFLLTIASLLLFTQSSDSSKQETSKLENLDFNQETSELVSQVE
jgi:CHASE3 domain sensor protein